MLLAAVAGCASPRTTPPPQSADAEHRALLDCLGAPAETIYQPDLLAAPPAPGLAVHTFQQDTAACGPALRRYVSYVPPALGARTAAPVVIVLHGQGASAEAMMTLQTHGTFNRLAEQAGFVVVYANGLPTAFNIPGLPNSGRWRSEYTDLASSVDEVAYLQRIAEDLQAHQVIAGGNDLYLVGQSNGGGMALSAARQRPDGYAGVAAFMPFVGFSPAAPESLTGARLKRVMFAFSNADPGLPPDYAAQVLAPLARGWARALQVAKNQIDAPAETPLPDLVKEGQGASGAGEAVATTRDSTVKRLDLRSPGAALRELVFDHAGHFWPTRAASDSPALVAQYGLRNQDIEAAEEVWHFFHD